MIVGWDFFPWESEVVKNSKFLYRNQRFPGFQRRLSLNSGNSLSRNHVWIMWATTKLFSKFTWEFDHHIHNMINSFWITFSCVLSLMARTTSADLMQLVGDLDTIMASNLTEILIPYHWYHWYQPSKQTAIFKPWSQLNSILIPADPSSF